MIRAINGAGRSALLLIYDPLVVGLSPFARMFSVEPPDFSMRIGESHDLKVVKCGRCRGDCRLSRAGLGP